MYIFELRTVDDLTEGQIAIPEPGVSYRLRTMDNKQVSDALVKHVFRNGESLFALTVNDERFPVTGAGHCVLVPVNFLNGL